LDAISQIRLVKMRVEAGEVSFYFTAPMERISKRAEDLRL
jgi:hypothetical protein